MSDTSKNENNYNPEGRKKNRTTYCKCENCGKRTIVGQCKVLKGNICSECYARLERAPHTGISWNGVIGHGVSRRKK